jgi:hypothetical protein
VVISRCRAAVWRINPAQPIHNPAHPLDRDCFSLTLPGGMPGGLSGGSASRLREFMIYLSWPELVA